MYKCVSRRYYLESRKHGRFSSSDRRNSSRNRSNSSGEKRNFSIDRWIDRRLEVGEIDGRVYC